MSQTVSRTRDVLGLTAFVVLCFGVSVLGGMAARLGVAEWYPALKKPSWTPPHWVFGPVWTFIYPMVAVAGWLAWREGRARLGPLVYLLQLALNAAWPWFFFAQRRPDRALVCIAALCVFVVATIAAFWRLSRRAALLLVPYLAWVAFAAALNLALWRMN
ncbi:MAG TPA: TspO/MBR family protein [Vicinamibacteria bacterium]|nr:TspO/MBR family protein [Vicinamibacteria bacterium]